MCIRDRDGRPAQARNSPGLPPRADHDTLPWSDPEDRPATKPHSLRSTPCRSSGIRLRSQPGSSGALGPSPGCPAPWRATEIRRGETAPRPAHERERCCLHQRQHQPGDYPWSVWPGSAWLLRPRIRVCVVPGRSALGKKQEPPPKLRKNHASSRPLLLPLCPCYLLRPQYYLCWPPHPTHILHPESSSRTTLSASGSRSYSGQVSPNASYVCQVDSYHCHPIRCWTINRSPGPWLTRALVPVSSLLTPRVAARYRVSPLRG